MTETLLTTTEVCERYGICRDTLRVWSEKGLRRIKEDRKPGQRGRRRNLYRPSDVEAFATAHVRGGAKKLVQGTQVATVASALPAPLPILPDLPEAAETGYSDLDAVSVELVQAARVTYALYKRAVEENEAARGKGAQLPRTIAELALLQKAWLDTLERARRWHKDIPAIQTVRGRYVDVHAVNRVVLSAVTAMTAELEQLGLSIAPDCAHKSAREVRTEIDKGVRRAQEHIQRALRELMGADNGASTNLR